MSFVLHLDSYVHGHLSGGVRRAMLCGLLPVSAEEADVNVWQLHYGKQQCTLELSPSAYDLNTIPSLCLRGFVTEPELWAALLKVMQRDHYVCSDGRESLIASEPVRAELPEELREAARVVSSAEALMTAVLGGDSSEMQAAS